MSLVARWLAMSYRQRLSFSVVDLLLGVLDKKEVTDD
ncbi:hypothetical protein Q426_08360 [Streptococcus equi subsp. zooepidemicus CY]|nr:hypothetical protein Q426_08360 [Streptococcus equi subsp. zooepidemicus CY]